MDAARMIIAAGGKETPSNSPKGESGYQINCKFYDILFHICILFLNDYLVFIPALTGEG
jgi:hypothetical protein